jgi:peptidoglycan/LPS O-acetylase OafA/YrhL
MGVDLFFVLSGFLITGILLDTREAASRFYFGGFYGRRVLRIAPAFLGLMAALILAPGLTGQNASAHGVFIAHEAWYWTFFANGLIAIYGWGGVIPQTAPLWSLAVEEQFYLIWPSVVRRITAPGILRLGLLLIALTTLARFVLALFNVSGNTLYVLMPTRADLLAWGAVLAALVRIPNGVWLIRRLLWPALAAALIVFAAVVARASSFYFTYRAMVIAGYPAIALSAACLVAIAIVYDPAALRLSWLRGMGKISYGFYLWHMTAIAVLLRILPPANGWFIPLAFLLSLVPTLLSWYLIEQPALSLKRYAPVG